METTVLKPVAVYVILAGGDPTAQRPSVQRDARTMAAVWTENVNATKASPEKTVPLRPALWIVEPMATVWGVFVPVRMVSLVRTALRAGA